jgi:hypothetical protein
MGETVVVRRTDRCFVEMLSIEHPVLHARDFSPDERGFRCKICGAMQRPYLKLAVMVAQSYEVRVSLLGRN